MNPAERTSRHLVRLSGLPCLLHLNGVQYSTLGDSGRLAQTNEDTDGGL